jgi:hypothetical protein
MWYIGPGAKKMRVFTEPHLLRTCFNFSAARSVSNQQEVSIGPMFSYLSGNFEKKSVVFGWYKIANVADYDHPCGQANVFSR